MAKRLKESGDSEAREFPGGLRTWRLEHGITLEELSDLTGYSVPFLSRVERHQRGLGALDQVRVARRLGARVRDLFPAEAAESVAG